MEVEGSLRRSIFMETTGSREASSTCGGNGDGSRSRDQAMTDASRFVRQKFSSRAWLGRSARPRRSAHPGKNAQPEVVGQNSQPVWQN
ncbi:hypothetical protein ACOSQ2_023586 [Xanthoceras sorbifolium]